MLSLPAMSLFAQTTNLTQAQAFTVLMAGLSILVGLCIVSIMSMWKIFEKAKRPGWAAVVPVYNTWVLFELTGFPPKWAWFSVIPVAQLFPAVVVLMAYFRLALHFGKTETFALCTVLFPVVCLPILGFGDAVLRKGEVTLTSGPLR